MSQRKLKKIKQLEKVVEVKNEEVAGILDEENLGILAIIKRNWLFLVILLLGVIAVYFNAMNGAFVSDDYATIPNNPNVMNIFDSMGDTPNMVQGTNSIIANLFGVGNPIPFHVLNLTIFLIICVLAFVFTYLLLGRNVAYLSTILYAFLPIHVEAVTWISGRPYSLSTMFMLVALCSFLLFLKTKKKRYLYLLIGFELLAVFCAKVLFLSLFLIIIGYMFTYWKRHKINIGKFLMIVAGLMILSFIILSPAITQRVNVVNGGYNASDSIFYNPLFQYPTSMAKYLQLIFVPTDLTLYHTMYVFPVWLNWTITLTYLTILIFFYFKNKNIFFSLAFIFLAAAPTMAPVKVSWLVAERYMFFGSLGFCLFLGLILQDISSRIKYVVPGILVLFLVYYSVRIYFRNNDWNTNHNLWVNTCQVSPNSHNAWNNIGDDYDKLKQYDNAIKGFTQSTLIKTNYADAYHNRANIFFKIGRLDLARDSYDTALYYSPGLFQTYLSLTQIDLMEGKLQMAFDDASKALQISPNSPQAAYVLAIVYAQAGQVDQSQKLLESIIKLSPQFQPAVEALKQLKLNQVGKS
jgi:hypothetical protein